MKGSSPSHRFSVLGLALLITMGVGSNVVNASTTAMTATSRLCIVPTGAIVNPQSGFVLLPNDTVVEISSLHCAHEQEPLSTSGNVAFGLMGLPSSSYYTNFQDEFTVPSIPSSGSLSNGQHVVFWDGIESLVSGNVLQPVFLYGCNPYNGVCEDYWQEYGYAFYPDCNVLFCENYQYESTGFEVYPGNQVIGEVLLNPHVTFCPSDGPAYTVAAGDFTTGDTTNLVICDTNQYLTGVAGSMEIYDLSACSQLPAPGAMTFSSISYTTSPSGETPSYSTGSGASFCSAVANWNSGDSQLGITWTY